MDITVQRATKVMTLTSIRNTLKQGSLLLWSTVPRKCTPKGGTPLTLPTRHRIATVLTTFLKSR